MVIGGAVEFRRVPDLIDRYFSSGTEQITRCPIPAQHHRLPLAALRLTPAELGHAVRLTTRLLTMSPAAVFQHDSALSGAGAPGGKR
ncbi:hypothetical protein GCM10027199_82820 [Amycolatopsis magusensis]